jgi:hypothetical protein
MLRSGAQGAPTLVARRHLSNWPAEVLVRPSSGSSRPGSVISECLPHADWTGRESEGAAGSATADLERAATVQVRILATPNAAQHVRTFTQRLSSLTE